jgi:catechol 2,3-dioxygenase-like lactoylglutathione lyase family enzyme
MKLNYVTLGTNDMAAATAFYATLFDGTGMSQIPASDRMTYWLGDDFAFALAIPFDQAPASNGNGTMVGFAVGTADEVIRLHAKALALGGRCEGEPRQRGPKFSAYVRDLDGNKLCFAD